MSAFGRQRMLTTIDVHAGGEPLRLVSSGIPRLQGTTILERGQEMLEQHEHLHRILMFESQDYREVNGRF